MKTRVFSAVAISHVVPGDRPLTIVRFAEESEAP
jgi:hypothetical protein